MTPLPPAEQHTQQNKVKCKGKIGETKKNSDFAGGKKDILCLPEKQTLKWTESFKFKVYVSLVPMPVAQDNDIVFTVGMNSIKVFPENSPKGVVSQLVQTEGICSFH